MASFGLLREKTNEYFSYVKYIFEKRLKVARLNGKEIYLRMVLQSCKSVSSAGCAAGSAHLLHSVYSIHMCIITVIFSCNLDHKLMKARILILSAKSPVI